MKIYEDFGNTEHRSLLTGPFKVWCFGHMRVIVYKPFNNFEVGFFHFLKWLVIYYITWLFGMSRVFKAIYFWLILNDIHPFFFISKPGA